MLDKADVSVPTANPELWEKVIRKVRTSAMPPAGVPRPDKASNDGFANYLENSLDRAATAKPNPGRPAVHRLNRSEYANAVRDLLGMDISSIDIPSLLPTDDSGYGFDNIGDVLSVSPLLMEAYLTASRKIVRFALGDPKARPVTASYEIPRYVLQETRMSEDLPFGSRGGISVRHNFPADAEYVMKVRLQKNDDYLILGLGKPRQLDIFVDGKQIKELTIGGDEFRKAAVAKIKGKNEKDIQEQYLRTADESLEFRFVATAGTHTIGLTFPGITYETEGVYQPAVTDYDYAMDYGHPDVEPAVGGVMIDGPYDAKGPGETPSHRKVFSCNPTNAQDAGPCARKILGRLARRAFRRPVSAADVDNLMKIYQSGMASAKDAPEFEEGIRAAIQRILVDPEFLFRIERDPSGVAPGTAFQLSDVELASRLSFFLWSSIPDDELLDLAERNKLKSPDVLERQVHRMLTDARSEALVSNFAGQWLYLRNVQKVWPNPDVFPDFDVNLRDDFQRETELLFQSIVREDRSIVDLLRNDYTFVNERLAHHYGISNIYGSHFRRVPITDENRRGLLGQASILTVTSYATRTAPTIRGRWVMENILGTPPPPPPPNVPSLEEKKGSDGKPLTMRQQMEAHRANPACASCHSRMDPLGFALENFDATGRWRVKDGNATIDSSGVLPDGTKFQGAAELRKILLSHPDQFVTTVTEKLLTYAMGRGVEYYDQPAIRKLMREAAPGGYRWSALVTGIVKSVPFQMRRPHEP